MINWNSVNSGGRCGNIDELFDARYIGRPGYGIFDIYELSVVRWVSFGRWGLSSLSFSLGTQENGTLVSYSFFSPSSSGHFFIRV